MLPVRPHSWCCDAASPHSPMPGEMLFRLFHMCQDPTIDPALLALLATLTSKITLSTVYRVVISDKG